MAAPVTIGAFDDPSHAPPRPAPQPRALARSARLSMPWVETLGFLVMIALALSAGA